MMSESLISVFQLKEKVRVYSSLQLFKCVFAPLLPLNSSRKFISYILKELLEMHGMI